ncbi:MAG: hypothetical protein JNM59_06655 [Hyphomonadaceae bacterium]|nr:hypothetical protein [Hyphomonadaceae bacterium]
MQEKDAVERRENMSILALRIGEWVMFSTGVVLLLWPLFAHVNLVTAPPNGALSSMSLFVLSMAFAWNCRWLRGASISTVAVLLWLAASWCAILLEASGIV